MVKELKADLRTQTGTRHMIRLRRQGRIPGVLYGGGQPASTPLSVDSHELLDALRAGERVLALTVGERTAQVLIKAVQYDHLGEEVLHVDFNELKRGQKVRVRVPVALKGTPKGQADGGILAQALHEIEVECLPTAIPDRLQVDVEPLAIGEAVHVSEIKVPEGVVVITKGTDVVAACAEPRAEETPGAVAVEGAPLEPEVIMEKKEEPEAAAAGGDEKKPGEAKKAEAKKAEAKKKEAK